MHVFGIKRLIFNEYAYEYCLWSSVEAGTLRKEGRHFLEEAAAGFRELLWLYNYNFAKRKLNDESHRIAYPL